MTPKIRIVKAKVVKERNQVKTMKIPKKLPKIAARLALLLILIMATTILPRKVKKELLVMANLVPLAKKRLKVCCLRM